MTNFHEGFFGFLGFLGFLGLRVYCLGFLGLLGLEAHRPHASEANCRESQHYASAYILQLSAASQGT